MHYDAKTDAEIAFLCGHKVVESEIDDELNKIHFYLGQRIKKEFFLDKEE